MEHFTYSMPTWMMFPDDIKSQFQIMRSMYKQFGGPHTSRIA